MDIEIETDSNHLDDMLQTITTIYEKYKTNEYMESKVYNFVCNQLTTTLENIERTHQERIQRIDDLTIDQQVFIQSFLY